MWIFSKYGFFSVTQHAKRKDNIQIRARLESDLAQLKARFRHLDRCPIIETPDADYRWRIVIARWKWELIGAELTADLDYSNFKGKIAQIPEQRDKGQMLHRIWDLHHDMQERATPRKRREWEQDWAFMGYDEDPNEPQPDETDEP